MNKKLGWFEEENNDPKKDDLENLGWFGMEENADPDFEENDDDERDPEINTREAIQYLHEETSEALSTIFGEIEGISDQIKRMQTHEEQRTRKRQKRAEEGRNGDASPAGQTETETEEKRGWFGEEEDTTPEPRNLQRIPFIRRAGD